MSKNLKYFQNMYIQIDGDNCLSKKWSVRTWKPDGSSGWALAKQEIAFIDGMGWLRIVVNDDLRPQMTDRLRQFSFFNKNIYFLF